MDRQTLKHDLTLMLLSMSSWEEDFGGFTLHRAWKGYDFDILDLLEGEGYIDCGRKAKSVTLSNAGMQQASELMEKYGVTLDPEPEKQRFFRLTLDFDFCELACTRTLLVPEHTTFEDFHTMIQACLNWMNYHLYDFKLMQAGEELFVSWPDYETGGDPRLDFLMEGDEVPRWLNSATTYLDEFFPKTQEAVYSYDYGDGWEIRVRVVNRESIASDNPICQSGSGDAPPEDVGGEGGFEDFLRTIEDPFDEEYESMRGWGKGQGFEHFDRALANKRLSHWQDWARTDTNMMPREAQTRAFGKVVAEPPSRDNAASLAHLKEFQHYLDDQGLARRTKSEHFENVLFFALQYLMPRYLDPVQGLDEVERYLGDWLVNSCEYTSKTFLRSSATSLNKFYKFMADSGYVSPERQQEVQRSVRKHLPQWVNKIR